MQRGPIIFLLFALVPGNELREATLAAVGGLFLIEKREIVFVEDLKELFPFDRLEFALTGKARIVDAQERRVTALGSLHHCRVSATLFHPATNLFVIGRDLCLVTGR